MKYVDEFRDRAVAEKLAAQIAREAEGDRDLPLHGILRRAYPRHFPLRRTGPDAGQRPFRPWAGLSGLRAAGRAGSTTPSNSASGTARSCAPMAT